MAALAWRSHGGWQSALIGEQKMTRTLHRACAALLAATVLSCVAGPVPALAYLVTPAVLDSVAVRPAQRVAPPGEAVPVEILVKGALPDACSELGEATQTRAMNLIDVTLTMRRPRGAACAQVVRPFRFYLPLDGTFPPGSYTLKVNGAAYPFRIREGQVENG